MSLRRFLFLWHNFHLKEEFEDEEVADMGEDESEENEDELVEIDCCATTRIEQEEEEVDNSEEGEEDDSVGEEMDKNGESVSQKVWFDKVHILIDHIRVVSVGMIYILGTWLSIDEMMARFMGRSIETYRMKNKPILEGFIFFVLTTSSR